jgi:archaellum component FlaF (FlaF/FlaG flagellin family)
MSSRNQVVMAGTLAVAIALAAIVGAVYLLPSPTQQSSTSEDTMTTAGNSTPAGGQTQAGSQGTLSVLLTDPPTVPPNVTAIYVTYSNVAVHVSDAGNQTGWTNANATGTIDLMKMVNVSSTIATVKVNTGVYNALRFNVSSARVTYNGENYTAFVPKAELTVIIPGGIQVNSTTTAGAIIDMHPTVLNIGSRSTPEFIVDTAASVFGLPPGTITKAIEHAGYVMRIDNQQWWQHINETYTADIQITSASVTNSSLSVTISNIGNQSVTLNTITVAPVGSECATPMNTPHDDHMVAPLCFTGSAVFLVQNDSSLKSFSAFVLPPIVQQIFSGFGQHGGKQSNSTTTSTTGTQTEAYPGSTGYTLAPGKSVTLTYSGSISFGFAFGGRTSPGVLSGDQYQITAVGQEALAETVVVAG